MRKIEHRFYDAVDDPSIWDATWRDVMRKFDAQSGCLYLEDPKAIKNGATFLSMPGFTDAAIALFGAHYINLDPYTVHARQHGDTAPFLSQDVIAPERFRETEVWVDYSSRYLGAFHLIGAVTKAGGGQVARVAVHRPHDAALFDRDDLEQFSLLIPHLSRALRLRAALQQERRLAGLRGAALDGLASAVMVVDGTARILFANAATSSLAAAGRIALGRLGAELRLASATQTRRLHLLIANVAGGGPGGAMMGTTNDGCAPLAISVSRLPGGIGRVPLATTVVSGHPALVLMRDIDTAVALDADALNSLFGLSLAETEVAMALAAGQTAEGIAEQRSRSMPTVRAQIRHILRKTGVPSVRHLVSTLSRLHHFR